MNSITKLIFSFSALVASLSFAWVALTITGMNPHHTVTVYHRGDVGVGLRGGVGLSGDLELSSASGGFSLWHDGSVLITR
jgi:hypothetical protein